MKKQAQIIDNQTTALPNASLGIKVMIEEEVGDYYMTNLGPILKTDLKIQKDYWVDSIEKVRHLNDNDTNSIRTDGENAKN